MHLIFSHFGAGVLCIVIAMLVLGASDWFGNHDWNTGSRIGNLSLGTWITAWVIGGFGVALIWWW
jgi:hypothetical protein